MERIDMKINEGIHLGIIPDGSRRWAKMKGLKSYDGRQSGEVMETLVKHVFENHPEISDLSMWALSTENFLRPEKDKKLIFELLTLKMKDLLSNIQIYQKNVKVNIVGSRWEEMPLEIRELAQTLVSETIDHKGLVLNICIGYGGKEEILNAVIGASKWLRENPLEKNCKNMFEQFLLIPKPLDMVIRTGGEKRLSGFMLYQIEYAELFFTDTLWPEFTTIELDKILEEFSKRGRRFGR
jgi:undecaprenyl diphosphate synthase